MDRNEIKKKVVIAIEKVLGITIEESQMDTSSNDLGADSLDTVEIVMNVEDEFDLEICDEDAIEADSPNKLIELVEKELSK